MISIVFFMLVVVALAPCFVELRKDYKIGRAIELADRRIQERIDRGEYDYDNSTLQDDIEFEYIRAFSE